VGLKLANNAYTLVPQAVAAGDVSLTVATGDGAKFPELGTGDYFHATLLSTTGFYEIVRVVARDGDIFVIERGIENTAPLAFPANSRFELRVTTGNVDVTNYDVLLL